MRRLLPLISAFMLVLVLWTGTAAHAAEAVECDETSVAAAGHFEGDGDEVPADSDNSTPHHHGVCHGHCAPVPADAHAADIATRSAILEALPPSNFHSGTPPDSALRPPIA